MTQSKTVLKKELLKKYYDMACHNLLCYSKNYGMTEAKEGYESEWSQAEAERALLQEMMAELDEQEQKNVPLQRNEEARHYVKDVLVKEKGLRLYDVSKLVGCERSRLSKFAKGESVGGDAMVDQILALKEKLQRPVAVCE